MLNMGTPQSPLFKNERSDNLKEDPRDFIVHIRMNFKEKELIKKKAKKTDKNFSSFIRDSAMRV